MEDVEKIIQKLQKFYGNSRLEINSLPEKATRGLDIRRTEILINNEEFITLDVHDNGEVDMTGIENVTIDEQNISIFYEFMDDIEKNDYSNILQDIFINRNRILLNEFFKVGEDTKPYIKYLNKGDELTELMHPYYQKAIGLISFGVEDTLKPLNEYIEEIKNSDGYKKYVAELKETIQDQNKDATTQNSNELENQIKLLKDNWKSDSNIECHIHDLVVIFKSETYYTQFKNLSDAKDNRVYNDERKLELASKNNFIAENFEFMESLDSGYDDTYEYGLDEAIETLCEINKELEDYYTEKRETTEKDSVDLKDEPLNKIVEEYENSLIKDTSLEEAKELVEKDNTPTPKLQKQGTR